MTARFAELLLLRHGIAEERRPDLDDAARVLTARGRERTEREYGELFRRGGFELTRIVPTMSPAAVVEGRKA